MKSGHSADKAREIVLSVCRERSLRPDLFFGKERGEYLNAMRVEAVLRLYDAGYSRNAIVPATQRSRRWITDVLISNNRSLKDARDERTYTPPNNIRGTIKTVAEELGVELSDIVGTCREPRFVEARKIVAAKLDAQGYGPTTIARAMHKDHTTIIHYLDGGARRANKYFQKRAFAKLPDRTKETVIAYAEKIGSDPHTVMAQWIIEKAEGVRLWKLPPPQLSKAA